jgi:RNA polymerase sporulation-specific sigma factor
MGAEPSAEGERDRDDVARAAAGDEEALRALLGRYGPLLRILSRRYFLPSGEAEDVLQEAAVGFLKAVRDYRAEHGVPFRSFAELCVTRQVISAVKAATRLKHVPLNRAVSLQRPGHEDGSATLEEILPDAGAESPEEHCLRREEAAALGAALRSLLSPYERRVAECYLAGMTFQQIAAACGTHLKSVDNALWRIKGKLRRHFARDLAAAGGG